MVQGWNPAADRIGTFIVQDSGTQAIVDCSTAGFPAGVSLAYKS